MKQVEHGATGVIYRALIKNATTGALLTGLTHSSAGLIIATITDTEATPTVYAQGSSNIETIAALATYVAPTSGKCRFKEVDATNHKGLYEFQFADARYGVADAQELIVSVTGANAEMNERIQLVPWSLSAAPATLAEQAEAFLEELLAPHAGVVGSVAERLTRIPNVAPGGNGGLPTVDANNAVKVQSGTGANQINLSSGRVDMGSVNGDATAAANLAKTTRAIGRGTATTGGTTTSIPTSAFSLAAVGTEADQFKGRIITFDADTTTVALRGQSTDIIANTSGATPTFTCTALTEAPASGDTFSVT